MPGQRGLKRMNSTPAISVTAAMAVT